MDWCSRLKSSTQGTDTGWCWILCLLAALCNALHFGVSLSFGVVLPCLLEQFKQSIDITGTSEKRTHTCCFGAFCSRVSLQTDGTFSCIYR